MTHTKLIQHKLLLSKQKLHTKLKHQHINTKAKKKCKLLTYKNTTRSLKHPISLTNSLTKKQNGGFLGIFNYFAHWNFMRKFDNFIGDFNKNKTKMLETIESFKSGAKNIEDYAVEKATLITQFLTNTKKKVIFQILQKENSFKDVKNVKSTVLTHDLNMIKSNDTKLNTKIKTLNKKVLKDQPKFKKLDAIFRKNSTEFQSIYQKYGDITSDISNSILQLKEYKDLVGRDKTKLNSSDKKLLEKYKNYIPDFERVNSVGEKFFEENEKLVQDMNECLSKADNYKTQFDNLDKKKAGADATLNDWENKINNYYISLTNIFDNIDIIKKHIEKVKENAISIRNIISPLFLGGKNQNLNSINIFIQIDIDPMINHFDKIKNHFLELKLAFFNETPASRLQVDFTVCHTLVNAIEAKLNLYDKIFEKIRTQEGGKRPQLAAAIAKRRANLIAPATQATPITLATPATPATPAIIETPIKLSPLIRQKYKKNTTSSSSSSSTSSTSKSNNKDHNSPQTLNSEDENKIDELIHTLKTNEKQIITVIDKEATPSQIQINNKKIVIEAINIIEEIERIKFIYYFQSEFYEIDKLFKNIAKNSNSDFHRDFNNLKTNITNGITNIREFLQYCRTGLQKYKHTYTDTKLATKIIEQKYAEIKEIIPLSQAQKQTDRHQDFENIIKDAIFNGNILRDSQPGQSGQYTQGTIINTTSTKSKPNPEKIAEICDAIDEKQYPVEKAKAQEDMFKMANEIHPLVETDGPLSKLRNLFFEASKCLTELVFAEIPIQEVKIKQNDNELILIKYSTIINMPQELKEVQKLETTRELHAVIKNNYGDLRRLYNANVNLTNDDIDIMYNELYINPNDFVNQSSKQYENYKKLTNKDNYKKIMDKIISMQPNPETKHSICKVIETIRNIAGGNINEQEKYNIYIQAKTIHKCDEKHKPIDPRHPRTY
uniref:Uncharacterized protein n=1 Tax=viral metagenome TaxID=1070528 RepID=A0A6C0HLS6_9ZZZZ